MNSDPEGPMINHYHVGPGPCFLRYLSSTRFNGRRCRAHQRPTHKGGEHEKRRTNGSSHIGLGWAMQESNLRPLRCERSALAAAPIARIGKDHRSDPRGRYWIRTSDPFRVREVRYLCANRPGHSRFERGGYESRTRLYGFAGRCLTAWLTHRIG